MVEATFIKKVADKIHELGLTTPAILLLETHKPLAFIGSQLLLVAQPTLNIFFPKSRDFTQNSFDLLTNPPQLEQLITYLEAGQPDRLPGASQKPIESQRPQKLSFPEKREESRL